MMIDITGSPQLEDFTDFAATLNDRVCSEAETFGLPVGVVLAAVIYHFALDAQVGGVSEGLLLETVAHAAATFRETEARLLSPPEAQVTCSRLHLAMLEGGAR